MGEQMTPVKPRTKAFEAVYPAPLSALSGTPRPILQARIADAIFLWIRG
jgi:hypothetical protein